MYILCVSTALYTHMNNIISVYMSVFPPHVWSRLLIFGRILRLGGNILHIIRSYMGNLHVLTAIASIPSRIVHRWFFNCCQAPDGQGLGHFNVWHRCKFWNPSTLIGIIYPSSMRIIKYLDGNNRYLPLTDVDFYRNVLHPKISEWKYASIHRYKC
jgi:hypothetical protein